MATIVIMRMVRRPSRSPKCPASSAPMGRAMKPTPNSRNELITAKAGSSPPKNSGAKTMEEVVPNRKKSYHSRDVPT